MAEQQENKDWLDKLGEFFSKIFINPNKDIAYSIRKRGEDEIEIRDSIFDGYARGFIRFVLIGMTLINVFMVHPAFHFIANISRQKVIMNGLLIQINQLGSSIYGTKKWRIAIIKELKRKMILLSVLLHHMKNIKNIYFLNHR